MGSFVEINDTLQLTSEQGFPEELQIDTHLKTPYSINDVKDKIFSFTNKPGIRLFHAPPVRNFLVQNINGKWIYWGLVHVVETTVDYEKSTTSGKFKIIYLNTPEQMKQAYEITDRRPEFNYFNDEE